MTLKKIISQLEANDLAFDPAGRLIIRNPDIAAEIAKLNPNIGVDPIAFLDNCECTTNQKCRAQ